MFRGSPRMFRGNPPAGVCRLGPAVPCSKLSPSRWDVPTGDPSKLQRGLKMCSHGLPRWPACAGAAARRGARGRGDSGSGSRHRRDGDSAAGPSQPGSLRVRTAWRLRQARLGLSRECRPALATGSGHCLGLRAAGEQPARQSHESATRRA